MFWIAELLNNGYPNIINIVHFNTKDKALDFGVVLAIELGANERRETILRELELGHYIPAVHSEWSVCFGEVPASQLIDPK